MLLLTSTSDKLQVITGSAGTIDVHASWLDNVAGAVGPGRTNTNITTAATTDVVGAPAASVQRNIKTLHIRNRGAVNNTITVQHTDGTTVSQLHRTTLSPEQTLQYIDEIGFVVPPLVLVAPVLPASTRQVFYAGSGVYTTPLNVRYIDVELIGAGGGGAGGLGGAAGGTGGNTTFGPLTGGGGSGVAGGGTTGGDVNINGANGGGEAQVADGVAVYASGSRGADSYFAGGGAAYYNSSGLVGLFGSGGGGGGTSNTTQAQGGFGGGAGGYVRKILAPPAATYNYSVGVGGAGGGPGPGGYSGNNGGSGLIIVTEYY